MTIYVDMDGVLVDLVGKLVKEFKQVIHWEPGKYSLTDVFAITVSQWENLSIDWWASLDKTIEADQIVNIVQSYGKLRIATAPSSQLCIKGKFDWLRKHYPFIKEENIFFVDSKWQLADPNTILIDDHTETVERFEKAGGKAFLYPRHWNASHAEADKNNLKNLQSFLAKHHK